MAKCELVFIDDIALMYDEDFKEGFEDFKKEYFDITQKVSNVWLYQCMADLYDRLRKEAERRGIPECKVCAAVFEKARRNRERKTC